MTTPQAGGLETPPSLTVAARPEAKATPCVPCSTAAMARSNAPRVGLPVLSPQPGHQCHGHHPTHHRLRRHHGAVALYLEYSKPLL